MAVKMAIADKDKIKEVRYISVTVNRKRDGSSETSGLFIALRTLLDVNTSGVKLVNSDEEYVWLFRGNCAHIFHLGSYKITKIDIGFGEKCKSYNSMSFKEDEQDKAIAELKEVMRLMEEEGKLSTRGLVTVTDIYKEIPQDVAKALSLKSKTSEGTTQVGSRSRSGAVNYGSGGYGNGYVGGYNNGYRNGAWQRGSGWDKTNTTTTYTTTTSTIKRTTKYDKGKAMTRIRAKLRAIKAGTYKAPKLKELAIEKEDKSGPAVGGTKDTHRAVGAGAYDGWDEWDNALGRAMW